MFDEEEEEEEEEDGRRERMKGAGDEELGMADEEHE